MTIKNIFTITINRFKALTGVHICTDHTGKMYGIKSLSTSVLLNRICKARAKVEGSICHHCYAAKMANMYDNLEKALAKNTRVLTRTVIPVEYWPELDDDIFRLESFGDLNNTVQFLNYVNFCLRNPDTRFRLWTKNPVIIDDAIYLYGIKKPSNLEIIQSSVHVNTPDPVLYPFIDGIFTVYTKDFAEKYGIKINCGSRKCRECLECYKKHSDGLFIINELLK